jgi:protein-arginine kinase activator protein McsA
MNTKCYACGTTWNEVMTTGLLGCYKCYEYFEEELLEIRGGTEVGVPPPRAKHVDPKRLKLLFAMKRQLRNLVREERFTEAEELWRRIKAEAESLLKDSEILD